MGVSASFYIREVLMGQKKVNTHEEEDFLRAAWDMLGDVSVNHQVHVGYSFSPTVQRGVFKLRVSAYRATPQEKMCKLASYEMEFPNSTVGTLGACLFRCVNQLDHLLTDKLKSEHKHEGVRGA
jgi:hypothetical protein